MDVPLSLDIQRMRHALGESQGEFAQRFGVVQSTIARWELNGAPDSGPMCLLIEMVMEEIKAPRRPRKREPA